MPRTSASPASDTPASSRRPQDPRVGHRLATTPPPPPLPSEQSPAPDQHSTYLQASLEQHIATVKRMQLELASAQDDCAAATQHAAGLATELTMERNRTETLTRTIADLTSERDEVATKLARKPLLNIAAIAGAAVIALGVGITVGVALDQPESTDTAVAPTAAQAGAAPADLERIDMPCTDGSFVVWLAAGKSSQAAANLAYQRDLLAARSAGAGTDASLVKASLGNQACGAALANYSSPSDTRLHLWAGPFDSEDAANEWCGAMKLAGANGSCLVRPTT